MSSEAEERASWAERNEGLAEELLQVLDPKEFAVNASWAGISIYPRFWGPETTKWERQLFTRSRSIPAVWTGYLSACLLPPHLRNESSSLTASTSRKSAVRGVSGKRVQGAASSSTPSIIRRGSKSDGPSRRAKD